ncbi:hypothetical protein SF06_18590 [Pseudomonas flexibilis]|nr:hypothetical protein SF06_18590 [Pseudomonas flexibilis]
MPFHANDLEKNADERILRTRRYGGERVSGNASQGSFSAAEARLSGSGVAGERAPERQLPTYSGHPLAECPIA